MSEVARNTVIGDRYRIVRFIAKGGMGAVYEVEHVHTSERLALKLVFATAPLEGEALMRFRRESSAAARIKSEHVARVTDAGIDGPLGGVPFLVMDLLEGADLEEAAGSDPQSAETVVEWLRQVARGLLRAHELGLVHRDLKPQNLFLTERPDGTPLVKILDFGIVKHAELEGTPTATGRVLGTPMYMAPEQAALDDAPVTKAADLYALGLVAFRLLAGTNYRRSENMLKLLNEVLSPTLVPPSERGLALGAAFDRWFAKACAPSVAERFGSAPEQIEALAAALGLTVLPVRESTVPTDSGRKPVAVLDTFASAPTAAMDAPRAQTRKRPWRTRALLGIAMIAGVVAWLSWMRHPRSTAVAVASSGPAASTESSAPPIQLTDLPPPRTDNPEALTEYRNAWRDAYDAARPPSLALIRAVNLDPGFAAAQLRLSFFVDRPYSATTYELAARHRDRLDERDRALLQAYEPCEVPETPDYSTCADRLARLHRERPGDLEILRQLADIQSRGRVGGGIASFEELARLDPKMSAPELGLGLEAQALGKLEEATRHLQRCLEISPLAGSCALRLAEIQSKNGHCEVYAHAIRKIMVYDANDAFVLWAQLNAMLTTDAPRPVVEAALNELLALLGKDHVRADAWEPHLKGDVALWFGETRQAFDLLGQGANRFRGYDNSVLWIGREQLMAAEELDDPAVITTFLRDYIARRAARTNQGTEWAFLRSIHEHHALPEPEFTRLRDRWREEARTDQGLTDWTWWLVYDAYLARTPEEARAALAMPAAKPIPSGEDVDDRAKLGEVLLRAGRPEDAIPHLEVAARWCQPFDALYTGNHIPAIVRATYNLAQAHEALGQRDAACTAYGTLLARWGNAKPRPVTAEHAHQRAVALGCP